MEMIAGSTQGQEPNARGEKSCPFCFAQVKRSDWRRHWKRHNGGGLVDPKWWRLFKKWDEL
jgi:hypothetical protein